MRRAPGAVLPLVLTVLLIIAAASFAMSFKVTLDTLAARSALTAAQARAQAAAGLALAVAERHAAVAAGSKPSPAHGPWPQHGVAATVSVTEAGTLAVPAGDGALETVTVVRLDARATVGSATAAVGVTLYFGPELVVLERR